MQSKPTQKQIDNAPRMVHWFKPSLLLKLVWHVIVSDIFGQFADRRLIHAALDPATPEDHLVRADIVFRGPAQYLPRRAVEPCSVPRAFDRAVGQELTRRERHRLVRAFVRQRAHPSVAAHQADVHAGRQGNR